MTNRQLVVALWCCVLAVAAVEASAQNAAPSGGSHVAIDFRPLIEQIVPYIVAAAGAVITTLGGLAISKINAWGKAKGIEIDQSQRAALLASLKNVASGLIAKGAVAVEANGRISVPENMLTQAAQEVIEKRAPDAVAHLSVTPADVQERLIEQLAQMSTTTAAAKSGAAS